MLSLVAAFLLQASQVPCSSPTPNPEPPSLIVQAVDSTWLPLPGMRVTVTSTKPGGHRQTSETKREGFAEFWVPRDTEYSIEVAAPGVKRTRVKRVIIGPALEYTSTAYVQVQLHVDSPKVTIE